MWRQLNIVASVTPSITLDVIGGGDWFVCNELFIKGEYDAAIIAALQPHLADSGSRIVALDLGGNIGFFALRLASVALNLGIDLARITLISVEADRENFTRLVDGTKNWSTDWPGFKAVRGLVGERSGSATLYQSPMHVAITSKAGKPGPDGLSRPAKSDLRQDSVAYIDLESLLLPSRPIDLVKCDIEGSEHDFLRTYPDLLRRTRNLAVEFHHEMCDIPACRSLLGQAGLSLTRTLSDEQTPPGRRTTEFFSR